MEVPSSPEQSRCPSSPEQSSISSNNVSINSSACDDEDLPPIKEIRLKEEETQPDTSILASFKKYVAYARKHFIDFTSEEEASVQLLDIMFKKRSPLNTYDDMQHWRRDFPYVITSNDKGNDTRPVVPEEQVTLAAIKKKLYKRYNLKLPRTVKIKLPYSKAVIKSVYHDFKNEIISLLTDPRIDPDKDYVFHNNDPLSPPTPFEEQEFIEDIISGRAFIDTYFAKI